LSKIAAITPFKVIEITNFGAVRKLVCDFLLVNNINLTSYLASFPRREQKTF